MLDLPVNAGIVMLTGMGKRVLIARSGSGWTNRFDCKRLSDPAGNSNLNRYVFGQGSCHQQGHITIS